MARYPPQIPADHGAPALNRQASGQVSEKAAPSQRSNKNKSPNKEQPKATKSGGKKRKPASGGGGNNKRARN